MDKLYYRYWGKASREDGGYHLLPYHCLDVAAVGQVLLTQSPRLLKRLSRLTGMDEKSFIRWMIFFLALHDLGKFADGFQNLRPDILLELQQRKSKRGYSERHDALGYFFWQEALRIEFREIGILKTVSTGRRRSSEEEAIKFWMQAVTGHHGQPPKSIHSLMRDFFELPQDTEAAIGFIHDLADLLLQDDRTFPELNSHYQALASWWISGFTVLCDWLGSSRNASEYKSQPQDLAEYWRQAKVWASEVIESNELLPATPVTSLVPETFFGRNLARPVVMTPLQNEAMKLALGEGPQLFVLEDVTGAGKTEAALILLHRLMAEGKANGFYFGLPTMATANAMYVRVGEVYRQLYSAEATPSLVLAHGARNLSRSFRQSFLQTSSAESSDNGDGTISASYHCSAWLADNRKKALLAEVGVGTIDQALLGILPSRHQSLRLFGLLDKVLLVDEVHACDDYMHTLLCKLLYAHSAAGGSAILLSATLPHKQRQSLVRAFAEGLNITVPKVRKTAIDDYPLISHCHAKALSEIKTETRESVRRQVDVEIIETNEAVYQRIAEAIKMGQCVCWIRNTVKDARDAYVRLQQDHSKEKVRLFHARLAMADRLAIEESVVRQFGPDSTAMQRRGQVLVATQVVEQSLDLDFDVMISDLAPIDLIIQRAGRLQRHSRDAKGSRIKSADQRGGAKIFIHSPPWQEQPETGWLKNSMPGIAAVYENQDGLLWQGLKLLRESGGFRMPEDARRLIEGVYSDEARGNLPQGLSESALKAEGDRMAQTSQGRMNALKLELGYQREDQNIWWDEAVTPTRLGDESITVYLARWQNGELKPWIAESEHPWASSALSISKSLIAETAQSSEIPDSLFKSVCESLPASGKWGVLLSLSHHEGTIWKGVANNQRGETMQYYYHSKLGLMSANDLPSREAAQ